MNKLIVITGATRGIGHALALKFAAAGFDLAVTARNQDDLDLLKNGLEKMYGVSVFTKASDLADASGAHGFTTFVSELQRPVDVLINNAGFFVPGKITEESDGVLESMMEVNVYSAYHVTRGILPLIAKQNGCHIFTMCSIASFMAYPNGGSYTISKFALLGFSKVLREELKQHGIRVTSVMPGATMTSSWEGSGVPEDRLMKASDVADAVFGAYSLSGLSVVEEIVIRPQLGDL